MQEGQKSMTMMASSSSSSPAARNSTGMPAGKKPRKPYKITRPREKWAADEHDRFLHALLLFGRDWKRIEHFVATKTATQIRSHAQKYFLKAQKLGLAAALPPPQPRRGAVLSQLAAISHPPDGDDGHGNVAVGMGMAAAPAWPLPPTSPPPPPMSLAAPSGARQQQRQSADCWTSCSGGPSEAGWAADDAVVQVDDDTTRLLPLSPDDPRFAMVYRFVGDVFGAGAPWPVEAQLQRLQGVDPVVVDTILLVLSNLQDNFVSLRDHIGVVAS